MFLTAFLGENKQASIFWRKLPSDTMCLSIWEPDFTYKNESCFAEGMTHSQNQSPLIALTELRQERKSWKEEIPMSWMQFTQKLLPGGLRSLQWSQPLRCGLGSWCIQGSFRHPASLMRMTAGHFC